jgi:hypothetical protein
LVVEEPTGSLLIRKQPMICLGFPTECEPPEAHRTDFSRYFRQLHNPVKFDKLPLVVARDISLNSRLTLREI